MVYLGYVIAAIGAVLSVLLLYRGQYGKGVFCGALFAVIGGLWLWIAQA